MLINFEPYMHLVHHVLGHDVVIAKKRVPLVAITPKEPLTSQNIRDDALTFRLYKRDYAKLKLDNLNNLRGQTVVFMGEFMGKKQPSYRISGASWYTSDTILLQLQPLRK